MSPLRLIRRAAPPLLALARREIGPIAAVLTVGFFLLSFLHLADEMVEGETHAFDHAIIYALRRPGALGRPIGPDWLATAALDVTSLGSIAVLTLIVALVCGLVLSLRRVREASLLLLATGGGMVITTLLKDLYERPRPPLELHLATAVNASFPSGHATLSATVYLTLGALIAHFAHRRRVRVYALTAAVLLSVLVGLSRVYLGVHWPTDVLAGWCVGSAWALACWGGAVIVERVTGRRIEGEAGIDQPRPEGHVPPGSDGRAVAAPFAGSRKVRAPRRQGGG